MNLHLSYSITKLYESDLDGFLQDSIFMKCARSFCSFIGVEGGGQLAKLLTLVQMRNIASLFTTNRITIKALI